MGYKIINKISSSKVPAWGNKKKYIAVHYLGVVGQNHDLASDGCGAHYYIYWDGTIYQRCSHDAVPWAVGTGGYYKKVHADAGNYNTISIEMCCKCDGNASSAEDKKWYFTTETQEACVWLVQKLMKDLNIPIDNVLRHRDIVNKTCPAPYVHNNKYKTSWTWDEFKAKVASKTITTSASTVTKYYRVRKSWSDEKSQLGAYYVKQNAIDNCPSGYKVFDDNGKVVYTASVPSGTQASDFSKLTEKEAASKILEMCKKDYEKTGVFASVSAAQMILESGYVKTELATKANNCFGMKTFLSGNTWKNSTWDGKSKVNIKTAEEYTAGNVTYINADFRKYDCIEDSIADHSAYLLGAKNGSKNRYDGLTKCKNYKEAITLIKKGGYATDSKYVDKICNIIKRFGLDKYDKTPKQDTSTTTAKPSATTSATKLNETKKWKGVVTANSLNVRTWAGSNNPTCSFSPLKKDTKVDVCDSVKTSDGSTWYFIKYNNKYGFVHSDYIKEKKEKEASLTLESAKYKDNKFSGTYKVTSKLNMRYVAGKITDKNIVAVIPKNDKVQCYGYYNMVDGVKWYLVAYKSYTGYVSSKYLKK